MNGQMRQTTCSDQIDNIEQTDDRQRDIERDIYYDIYRYRYIQIDTDEDTYIDNRKREKYIDKDRYSQTQIDIGRQ